MDPHRADRPAAQSVLVVDDDRLCRRMLEGWLANWGYEVVSASDGCQAWELLQQTAAPQLALLDWIMPGMTGLELCRKVRARPQPGYVYLLLLTARSQTHDLVDGLEAGADDYLSKPVDPEELRARIAVGFRMIALQNELLLARNALEYQATHDALTGLWNHGAILQILDRELERGRRTGVAPGVVMLDLDHFRQINDGHGHLVGDAVLRELARRLARWARAYDWIGRYAGDEFLVIFTDCQPADVIERAQTICAHVNGQPVSTGTGELLVTVSAGVALGCLRPDSGNERQELLKRADAALYCAKAKGRNRVEVHLATDAKTVPVPVS